MRHIMRRDFKGKKGRQTPCTDSPFFMLIQSIMGHANIETTMDIYAEATELKKQEAIKALENNSTIF